MLFSWRLFLLAVGCNSLLVFLQFYVQRLESRCHLIPRRWSIIPGTKQKFLYWQDYYTNTWGDLLGLVWLMNGIFHLLGAGSISIFQLFMALFMAVLITLLCWGYWLGRQHKPDWCFPAINETSMSGRFHLAYFGLMVGLAYLCILSAFFGRLTGAPLYLVVIGSLIWFFTIWLDSRAGHFEDYAPQSNQVPVPPSAFC